MDPSTILTAAQGAMGIIQTISGDSKLKQLLAQRTSYKTPEEYFKILQATQNAAQQGYDAFTLNYLTNQNDRAFDEAAGAATRLGANPNDLAAIFDRKIQASMKIGAENHALNIKNFERFLSAEDVIGQNAAAEWKSEQEIIKDKMQAAGAEKAAGVQNIGSAANAAISIGASAKTSSLYKQIADAVAALKKGKIGTGTNSGYVPGYAPDFDNYNQPQ